MFGPCTFILLKLIYVNISCFFLLLVCNSEAMDLSDAFINKPVKCCTDIKDHRLCKHGSNNEKCDGHCKKGCTKGGVCKFRKSGIICHCYC